MALYVRTGNGGTDPAYIIPDIGYVVQPGMWNALLISSGTSPNGGDGYFTSIDLKNSVDLYEAIVSDTIEWSLDGSSVELPADYNTDQVFVSEIVDSVFDFSDGGRVIVRGVVDPSEITAPVAGELVFTQDGYFLGYDGAAFNPIGDANPEDFIFPVINLTGGEQIASQAGELVFTDTSGVATLTTLKSMRNIWADGYGYGDILISDAVNWNAEYTHISSFVVETTSTDWELFLYDDNTLTTGIFLVTGGLGDMVVNVGIEQRDTESKVRINYQSNDGDLSDAVIRVNGEARRH
jgi:hypothetical protein